ncbi:DinB family protein [Dactylosporangium matsuzakiense]|uniref:Uncharacterized protein n=1 Tax=Dactylosporangium matsuzakiense TaxID=53360 RepID=A0A9W6KU73_9ACTN|nr:DinB family protein [Dactylosporangium matsuzakiense]GLL07748.1 hypothetical protein GCM10017581_095050 [Dactylosporangium matsuzakiense]
MPAFPEPTTPAADRGEVFVRYLDYFRATLLERVAGLPEPAAGRSVLPSGWTPLGLLKHLRHVELRWLEWGFEGRAVAEPWGDRGEDGWFVAPGESRDTLSAELLAQGAITRAVVGRHALDAVGAPGPRWDGAEPPTLERVLFHLVQEYARHVGHIDIVAELEDGPRGE